MKKDVVIIFVIILLMISFVFTFSFIEGSYTGQVSSFSKFTNLFKKKTVENIESVTIQKKDIVNKPLLRSSEQLSVRNQRLSNVPIQNFSKRPRPNNLRDAKGLRCTQERVNDGFCDFECYDYALAFEDVVFDNDCCKKNPYGFGNFCFFKIIEESGSDLCRVPDLDEIVSGATVIELDGGVRHINLCLDDGTVRHVICLNDGFLSEDTTSCPGDETCENGLCDGELMPICIDTDPEDDPYRFGTVSYASYDFDEDRCDTTEYDLLRQQRCKSADRIFCDLEDFNTYCDYQMESEEYCNSFCSSGICARPNDFGYDLEEEQNEFDDRLLHYTCVDSDNGLNQNVNGEAQVLVSYSKMHDGVNVQLNNEVIRTVRDHCIGSNVNGNTCTGNSVIESYCSEGGFILQRQIQCAENEVCNSGACVPEPSQCQDTDNGQNYNVRGSTSNDFGEHEDRCSYGEFGPLIEYFCNEDYGVCQTSVNRPEGFFCFDGAFSTCVDYDFEEGNWPAEQASYARDANIEHNDYCIDDNILAEMICIDGHIAEQQIRCTDIDPDNVCRNGECS